MVSTVAPAISSESSRWRRAAVAESMRVSDVGWRRDNVRTYAMTASRAAGGSCQPSGGIRPMPPETIAISAASDIVATRALRSEGGRRSPRFGAIGPPPNPPAPWQGAHEIANWEAPSTDARAPPSESRGTVFAGGACITAPLAKNRLAS